METTITQDFVSHTGNYYADRLEYDDVNVILIFWKDDDLNTGEELTNLRKLFGLDLSFHVAASYPLPSDGTQQARLQSEIANFIKIYALNKRSLSIIYYTGHCREVKGEAEWTAKRKGGPSLIWSHIQSSCFDALGDVLLILDCCHATLLTKGQKLGGRFEVLAACAKGLETPVPGPQSFTAALLEVLSKETVEKGITAERLCARMEEHTRETPFWKAMGSGFVTSIPIKKLQPPLDPRFRRKPAGYIYFRASLLDDLEGIEIANWLKTNAPPNVTAVAIEAVVVKARRLQGNLDQSAFSPNSVFRSLSEATQLEILSQLQRLDTRMINAKQNAQNPIVRGNSHMIDETFKAIQNGAESADISISTPLLLESNGDILSRTPDERDQLLPTTLEALSLHELILEPPQAVRGSFEICRFNGAISYRETGDRFAHGTMNDDKVIVDFFEYEPDENGDPYPETVEQVERMSKLLCHGKGLGFHILPGVGFIHESHTNRFGVVFRLGSEQAKKQSPPVTLRSLYKKCPYLSLSHRVIIACAIATSIENLHRVEWIHKEIRSDNICFFIPADDEHNDTSIQSPWLFGFEYARAMASGTRLEEDHSEVRNLYRHPQRWSKPQEKFTRAHDIYSLGVVLLEIADWNEVGAIVTAAKDRFEAKRLSQCIHSLQVNNALLYDQSEDLRHELNLTKKRKMQRMTMNTREGDEWQGGAMFWSPTSFRTWRSRKAAEQD
ncbi:unnamed protein product [Alternaria alternata]